MSPTTSRRLSTLALYLIFAGATALTIIPTFTRSTIPMSFDTTVERIEQLHEGSGSFLCRIHTKRFGIISDCSVARQLRPKERFIKDRWTDEIDTARGSISVAPSGEAIGALLLTPVLASALVLLTRRPRIF